MVGIGLFWLVVGLAKTSSNAIGPNHMCGEYTSDFKDRIVSNEIQVSSGGVDLSVYFHPLQFRAHNYGTKKYKLQLDKMNRSVLSISELDDGKARDSVKGGNLHGIYYKLKTVINIQPGRNVDIWNVYFGKEDGDVLVLLLSTKESRRHNPRLDPIFMGLSKLNRLKSVDTKSSWVLLGMNYDAYSVLPMQTGFGLYNTTEFPFEYPKEVYMKDVGGCGPTVTVYWFTTPLNISFQQMDQFMSLGQKLGMFETNIKGNQMPNESSFLGKMEMTPLKEHLLFRRNVIEAHSLEGQPLPAEDEYEDEYEDWDEDVYDPEKKFVTQRPIIPQDEELFPSDCAILYEISAGFESREANATRGAAVLDAYCNSMYIFCIITATGFIF